MGMIHNGLSGMVASQAVLNTVSQNLANVTTPGYTRQGVALSAKAPSPGMLSAGNGVEVAGLIRYADSYKTQQLWRANAQLGQFEAAQTYMLQLEQVMGDASGGISAALDEFFAALSAASVEPASSPLRQQIIEQAKALGQSVGHMAQIIVNQRTAVQQQREVAVDQLNSHVKDIAQLNQKIIEAHGAGLDTSALQDQRDARVDELSKLVGLQTLTQPDGSINLSLRGGQPLVVGARASTMEVVTTGTPPKQQLQVQFGPETFALESSQWQGTLGGLTALETELLDPIGGAITSMAEIIATEVNAVLTQGFATSGGAAGAPNGKALFVFDAASTSGLLTITDVTASELGLSSNPDEPGNSVQLQQLIALQQKKVNVTGLGNNILLGDVYTQLVGKLGTYSQQSQASYATAKTVRQQSEANWRSTSGVNADEEGVNLLQYQQMYQANMKVIAAANELFDSLLQLR